MLVNLNNVLLPAKQQKYAVGLFNTVDIEQMLGTLAAAETLNAPVIIGTAEVLLPFCPLENAGDFLVPAAKRAKVPVVVHYDHGLTYEKCVQALRAGFSSIMYDCSTDTYEENVRKLSDMVKIAHALGATVEGELGHVGEAANINDPTAYYTDPLEAKDFVKRTGIDALAIAVGTAHGAYKFKPNLDFERIKAIASVVDVPLVLHGGSGLSDSDFKKAIACGISKINVFTDLDAAAADYARESLKTATALTSVMPHEIEGVKRAVLKKMSLFGEKKS